MTVSDAHNEPQRSSTLLNVESTLCYEESIPEGWTLCVHPQGWIYFFNESLKVVTDSDIRTPDGLQLVHQCIQEYPIQRLEEEMEVHIYVSSAEKLVGLDNVAVFSLAINHRHCVASYTIEDILEPTVVYLDPRKQNRLRRLYWNYAWNHPTHIPTPPRAIQDAADALTWFYTDNMISGVRSIAPFSRTECDEISSRLKDLALPHHDTSIAKTVFLSWFLREVCSFRDAESYGAYTFKESLRVRQTRSAAQKPPSASLEETNPYAFMLLNLFINTFFFGIPRTYWMHLKHTSEFRGRLVAVQQTWESYIDRLVREYTHFLLISTVLLSATVGFLSIEELTEGARLAASVAALTSMSSIIIGVFSIWRHQANTITKHSYTYMHNIQHSTFGIPGHAILLSLPPTLLVWSMVAFTVAIVAYIAQGAKSEDRWNRISAATLLAVFGVLLLTVLLALYTFSIIWTLQRRRARAWSLFSSVMLPFRRWFVWWREKEPRLVKEMP